MQSNQKKIMVLGYAEEIISDFDKSIDRNVSVITFGTLIGSIAHLLSSAIDLPSKTINNLFNVDMRGLKRKNNVKAAHSIFYTILNNLRSLVTRINKKNHNQMIK